MLEFILKDLAYAYVCVCVLGESIFNLDTSIVAKHCKFGKNSIYACHT